MHQLFQLSAALAALYAETKRRNTAVRQAIDLAQQEAKKAPASAPIADLPEPSQTILCSAFIVGLDPKNPKMMASAMNTLQQLVGAAEIPESCVRDALNALHTVVPSSSVEMQLKTLQMLPVMVMNYPMRRSDFSLVLDVVARLVGSSGVVSNTAAATLQQILSFLFDKLEPEQGSFGDGSEELWMCCHVVLDLCHLISATPTEYFSKEVHFSPELTLDTLENVLHVNSRHFVAPQLMLVLREHLFPVLVALLQTKADHFPTFVRCLKLFFLMTNFGELETENSAFLGLCSRLAVAETTPRWQQAAVVELYSLILMDLSRVKILYEQEDHSGMIEDMFAVLSSILTPHSFVFNGHALFSDRICVPLEHGPELSKSSSLKVQVIDLLDKHEPPASLPDLYVPNLVLNGVLAYANGVSKFVSALSSDSVNPETLEADVEFITSLNEEVFPKVMALFQIFIYSHMSLDYFHMTVRFLQRYTHAIGLLGLSKQRDEVISLLAHCIKNPVKEEVPTPASANSNLLAFGGSIVESLSSTISSNLEKERSGKVSELDVRTRHFNPRQVLCLRALMNLATSLGSTLHESWKTILVAFQWAEYLMNGPESGTSTRRESLKYGTESTSSKNDLDGIQTSKIRFLDTVAQYQESSLTELVQALTTLYEEVNTQEHGTCPYNKLYFLNMLTAIAGLDFINFSFYDSKTRDVLSDFFCRISTDRACAWENRAYIVDCFTGIIVSVTKKGFGEDSEELASVLAQKSVSAFNDFLQRLLALGTPKEYLVLNCETEMHLTILATLHGLIDEYDKHYQDSWEMVFKILNTAFVESNGENKNLQEKIQRLISTSFDTLKLVLDEFTSSLPFNQLRSLIDSLMKFCSQTYDLNISFSAVSYFWLISDCINSEGMEMDMADSHPEQITDMGQLKHFLSQSSTANSESYQVLTIYLLAQLSTLSTDFRDQVREGAIQTLFQILDVRGKQLYSWKLVYDIVFPALLVVSASPNVQEKISRKSLVESYTLTLSGLVLVYSKYMTNFSENNEIVSNFWGTMVSYLSRLLQLHWNELDFTIFQSLRDILMALNQVEKVPQNIIELLFDFWADVSINYDFVQPEYQDSLAIYNETFKLLYKLMEGLSMTQAIRAMTIMNKCVKYPVLKPSANDGSRPSVLQKAVFDNLSCILQTSEDSRICALIIQQLAEISVFPYGIKSRIEKKLASKFDGKLKIPSFLAVSQLSIDLVRSSLHRLPEMKDMLEEEFQLGKIIRSLLESVYNQEASARPDAEALWVKSNEVIAQLILRLMEENIQSLETNHEVWQLLVECLLANFNGNNGLYDVEQYEKLSQRILPQFFRSGHNDLIREFVKQVYLQSYVFEATETEMEMLTGEEVLEGYYRLSEFQFDESFGSTQTSRAKKNRELRLKCLSELLEFPKEGGFSSHVTREMLLTRVAFSLRRFVADERLLDSRPLPQLQEQELMIILEGFLAIAQDMETGQLQGIMQLLSRGVEYSERIAGLEAPMKALLALGRPEK